MNLVGQQRYSQTESGLLRCLCHPSKSHFHCPSLEACIRFHKCLQRSQYSDPWMCIWLSLRLFASKLLSKGNNRVCAFNPLCSIPKYRRLFYVRNAHALNAACKLLEADFEYVTNIKREKFSRSKNRLKSSLLCSTLVFYGFY